MKKEWAYHQWSIVDVEKSFDVKTDKGLFYISASLGEIKTEMYKIISISEESPLAKAMFGKKVGEGFSVNNIQQTIKEIW